MKHIVKGIALVLLLAASTAQAIPTLFFDGSAENGGGINYTTGDAYDNTDNILNVSGVLFDTQDLAISPLLTDSSVKFSALFLNYETIAGVGFFGADTTRGNFISSDPTTSDLEIYDGNNTLLLAADFNSLSLEGANGSNRGEVFGILNATDGLLMNTFDNGNLFALQLNLTTNFSDMMYQSDFSGDVNGSIQGQSVTVPEPGTLALLGLGFLITGFARKNRRSI